MGFPYIRKTRLTVALRWRIFEAQCASYGPKMRCSSPKICTTTYTFSPHLHGASKHLFRSSTHLHPSLRHLRPPAPTSSRSHRLDTRLSPSRNSSSVRSRRSSRVLRLSTSQVLGRKQDGRVGRIVQNSRFGVGRWRRGDWRGRWRGSLSGLKILGVGSCRRMCL